MLIQVFLRRTLLLLFFSPALLIAQVISGHVNDSAEKPIPGALVTVIDKTRGIQKSVYTNQQGKYNLRTGLKGKLSIRARFPGLADSLKKIDLATGSHIQVRFQLAKFENAQRLSDSLTATAHAATIDWQDPENKKNFISQCHYCHQIGNALTRVPKNIEAWEISINRMEGYGALITNDDVTSFKYTLNKSFQGKPVLYKQKRKIDPEIFKAEIIEWSLGEPDSFMHDIELHPNGNLYAVDMSKDRIYELNRQTNKISTYNLPESKLPLGGMFSGAFRPLGTFAAKHGPHSVQVGPKGLLWTTNSLAAEIMSFDPVTHIFEVYAIDGAIYPHTLRFDQKGILWFTVALSNTIGRFDPETKSYKLIDTPSNGFFRWISDILTPGLLKFTSWFPQKNLHVNLSHHKVTGLGHRIFNLPYGIDINPIDGSIWYSKLYSSYIGRIDPETFEVTEIKSPADGPRRLRFDKEGILWIPSFEEAKLLRLDTKTMKFKHYKLPLLSESEYETPYALGIHPQTGDVWITSNLSDRIFRFNPSSESFISYDMPTRVSYMRDMVFDEHGNVCTSNSNMPAYAIEGGKQKLICLNPGSNN